MATDSQMRANIENAQHSTGPKTETGKATSSHNNFRHGFTGAFAVLPSEDQKEFDQLLTNLRVEHQPSTITEAVLVENMAQSYWLAQRAVAFQNACLSDPELSPAEAERKLALYLRYQTTNNRAFHRCLNDLLKLRAEKRRAEIGFESQQQKRAQEERREAAEKRKQDHHKWDMLLAEAKLDHQFLQNMTLRHPMELAAAMEQDRR
jgi:hypothetical protein